MNLPQYIGCGSDRITETDWTFMIRYIGVLARSNSRGGFTTVSEPRLTAFGADASMAPQIGKARFPLHCRLRWPLRDGTPNEFTTEAVDLPHFDRQER